MKTKKLLIICLTVIVCISVVIFGSLEIYKIRVKRDKVEAEKARQHDKERPLKIWERKQ